MLASTGISGKTGLKALALTKNGAPPLDSMTRRIDCRFAQRIHMAVYGREFGPE